MKQEGNKDNYLYWMQRAPGYAKVNREELDGIQHETWKALLREKLGEISCDGEAKELRILDIGAGPGFLSILMTELGHQVWAADFSEAMLAEARENAGALASRIHFVQEDAMDLSFMDGTFDVVISRNLTWNLPDPKQAYQEWIRVCKPDGLILIFDANWYRYLYDDEKRKAYEQDRSNVEQLQFEDYNIGVNFDKMEQIAEQLPMTYRKRPDWDLSVLRALGCTQVKAKSNIGALVYSQKELVNYASTPLFMIEARKESIDE